ncbi:putative GNAT family acetyltransferase [Zopfochytrium polystomum]|nr:putative GNAT family acetyltransferase [Zopfochytrium polystomum]
MTVSVLRATPADVPILARISGDAFLQDRQTQMKALGKNGYDMHAMALDGIHHYLAAKSCVVLKAVDDLSGEIMGWSCWAFRGLEKPPLTPSDVVGDDVAQDQSEDVKWRDQRDDAEEAAGQGDRASAAEKKDDRNAAEAAPATTPEDDDRIKRLEAMTGDDFSAWMKEIMPEGTRCLFVVSFVRGAGTALMKWGTDLADEAGVFCWVHSSEMAYPVYKKMGFKVVRELDVDLDAYAPAPPPPPDKQWGHYVLRYMIRLPNTKEAQTEE